MGGLLHRLCPVSDDPAACAGHRAGRAGAGYFLDGIYRVCRCHRRQHRAHRLRLSQRCLRQPPGLGCRRAGAFLHRAVDGSCSDQPDRADRHSGRMAAGAQYDAGAACRAGRGLRAGQSERAAGRADGLCARAWRALRRCCDDTGPGRSGCAAGAGRRTGDGMRAASADQPISAGQPASQRSRLARRHHPRLPVTCPSRMSCAA